MIGNIDDQTVARARHGDAKAFADLVAPHLPPGRRVATVVLGAAEGVDDVMQDAVLASWQKLDTFRVGADFRPWFLRVVANTARNHRRGRGRRAAMELRAAGRRETPVPGPDQLLVSSEERASVLAALNRLGPDDRLILALRHFEDLSEAAMAQVLGCPRGTVKSRLSRATQRLRLELFDSESGTPL